MNIYRLFKLSSPLTLFKRSTASLPLKWPEEPLDLSVDQRGGFYPAAFGEKLNSRYIIVRKLGWGQHSSVWLAKDELGGPEQPYVSIKILSAHATLMQDRVANELALLHRIRDLGIRSSHRGYHHILTLMDDFEFTGPQGRHICLVQQAMGRLPLLQDGKFPLPVVKSIIRQLLLALSFLHDECHIVHTDLKLDNILVDLAEPIRLSEPGYDGPDTNAVSNNLVSPGTAPLSSPLHLFTLNELEDMVNLSTLCIRLTDFGTAAALGGYHPDIIQPYALRAPEVIVGCGWDTKADIWNLGCLVFELLTGRWLFVPRGGPTWTAEAYHLAHMPAIAGEDYDIPFFSQGGRYTQYFDDNGELRLPVAGVIGLDDALKSYDALPLTELQLCISFLRSMLRLKPSDRTAASDLSRHPWLKT